MSENLLVRLLQATELRAKVISANIANQNTPSYLRRVVEFENELRDALADNEQTNGIAPSVEIDAVSPARPDGNNVNMEIEVNALRENRLLYESYISMLRGRFSLIEAAITEGR